MRKNCRRCIPLISLYSNISLKLTRNKALEKLLVRRKIYQSFFLAISSTPLGLKESPSASLVDQNELYRRRKALSTNSAPPAAPHNTISSLRPKVIHLPGSDYRKHDCIQMTVAVRWHGRAAERCAVLDFFLPFCVKTKRERGYPTSVGNTVRLLRNALFIVPFGIAPKGTKRSRQKQLLRCFCRGHPQRSLRSCRLRHFE